MSQHVDNRAGRGAVWRAVVNFLGNEPVTPAVYLPLIEHMAALEPPYGSFLDRLARTLRDPRDRAEIEQDAATAQVGYQIWQRHSKLIWEWALEAEDPPESLQDLEDWWFSGKRNMLLIHETKHGDELLDQLPLTAAEEAALAWARNDPALRNMTVYYLRRDLRWLDELEILRTLAAKTWPARPEDRKLWTEDEAELARQYYTEQQPDLDWSADEQGLVDPFELELVNHEQGLGFGLDGLAYCMTVILRAAFIDLVAEVLDHRRFPGVKGSLRCAECGRYVPRRETGYGQLYCGELCKKRAAKRRWRARVRARSS